MRHVGALHESLECPGSTGEVHGVAVDQPTGVEVVLHEGPGVRVGTEDRAADGRTRVVDLQVLDREALTSEPRERGDGER